jgi:hypothetical protein
VFELGGWNDPTYEDSDPRRGHWEVTVGTLLVLLLPSFAAAQPATVAVTGPASAPDALARYTLKGPGARAVGAGQAFSFPCTARTSSRSQTAASGMLPVACSDSSSMTSSAC